MTQSPHSENTDADPWLLRETLSTDTDIVEGRLSDRPWKRGQDSWTTCWICLLSHGLTRPRDEEGLVPRCVAQGSFGSVQPSLPSQSTPVAQRVLHRMAIRPCQAEAACIHMTAP
mmetsp:Transcript_16178/g.29126  ORF Transcript_16178/g.29126 Transcript_16178/m.29126 type:complete len:115 (+) Transcript_16178:1557-1901(+)